MKNSADLRGCYPPRPSASVDNTLLDLQNRPFAGSGLVVGNKLHWDATNAQWGFQDKGKLGWTGKSSYSSYPTQPCSIIAKYS